MDRLPETERSLGFPLATSRRMPEKPGREAAARARAKMVSTTPTGYFISERSVMEKRLAGGGPGGGGGGGDAEAGGGGEEELDVLALQHLDLGGLVDAGHRARLDEVGDRAQHHAV